MSVAHPHHSFIMLRIVAGALFSFHRWIAGWYEGALGIKETFLCLSIWDFQSLEKEMSVIDDSMVETKRLLSQEPFSQTMGQALEKSICCI